MTGTEMLKVLWPSCFPPLHIVGPYSELTDVDGVTYELDPRSAGRNAEHP